MAPESITEIEKTCTGYQQKLDNLKRKEQTWMDQVSAWRREICNHQDYRADHPEEKQYQEMREKLDQKLKTLTEKHEEYLNLLTEVKKQVDNKK